MTNENKSKRYYWIKLKDSFLTSDKVDFLLSQKDGANYVVIYQMLCLMTINTSGVLGRSIGEILIPFDEEKIQRDCKHFSIDTIRIALTLYKQLGMVYEEGNGLLKIADFNNLVGSETQGAIDMRRIRENKKLEENKGDIQCYNNVNDNVYQDIRDKRLENRDKENKSIEIENDVFCSSKSTNDSNKEFKNELFNEFWKVYPHKVGKQKCVNWWKAHKPNKELVDKMLKTLDNFKKNEWNNKEMQYIPHPYTWLNRGGWDDETYSPYESTYYEDPNGGFTVL